MSLSNDLISQFVKATKDDTKETTDTTVYGTVVYKDRPYVKLDGSDLLTPVSTTAAVKDGERVTVLIKNHTAMVTGNISSPSASDKDVQKIGSQITEFEIIMAYKVSTEDLEAANATIESLRAKVAKITDLDVVFADIETLQAKFAELEYVSAKDVESITATIESLRAKFGDFTDISTEDLDALYADIDTLEGYTADFTYVSADVLEAFKASIKELYADKLSVKDAEIKYANIDFANIGEAAFRKLFADSGLIKDLVVGDSTIAGELVGVTIKGDLIEGGTVKADKLVVKGSDGIYYKLNFEAGTFSEGEVVPTDSLHGSVITAKSITAEKVSVKDLVAFNATIGGFNISESAIYSGVKESVDNTTAGTYLDREGQVAFGDGTRFIKCYKDQNGKYQLEISADSITFGAGNTTIEDAISKEVDAIEVGGRNLLRFTAELPIDYDMQNGIGSWSRQGLTETEDGLRLDVGETVDSNSIWIPLVHKGAVENNEVVTLSFDYRGDFTKFGNLYFVHETNNTSCLVTGWDIEPSETQWKHYEKTFTMDNANSEGCISFLIFYGHTLAAGVGTWIEVKNKSLKLEKGNKATDWTPALEDVDDDIKAAQNTADNAIADVTSAQSAIQQLADSIATLIVDGNGASLMTQTENGWVFSIGEIESTLSTATENIDGLSEDVNQNASAVESLKQAIDDLGVLANYIKITVDGDQPCIELGESENDFKVRITNTEIHFADGTVIPTRITRQMMIIEKAMMRDGLQFGDDEEEGISGVWILKRRSNGNLGLMWKEVNG